MTQTSIWSCAHEESELRARRINGGGIQYRRQCLRCGGSASNAIPHADVKAFPPEWDETLAMRWEDSRRSAFEERKRSQDKLEASEQSARQIEHQMYLSTPEWRRRRQKVLERANFVCEGCLEARATEVHHRTYSHWKNEPLFDLVAVCRICHSKIHEA